MSEIGISPRTIRRNNYRAIYLIVLLLAGFVHPSFAQESSKKLLVAYSGLVSGNASLWIAEDLGLFKKHGPDVALHRVNPRLANVKAAELVDNSFMESGWKNPVTLLKR